MSSPSNSTKSLIPTQHERLSHEQVVDFGAWMNGQLAQLEEYFREFMTINSLRGNEGRSSQKSSDAGDAGVPSDEPPYSR